jgi:high affinity Mn2+ porin
VALGADPPDDERWNLFYQATSVGQYHGTFRSPYSGMFSLHNYPERDVSLTTTLFLGLRLENNTVLYFDPEIAGGKGFSNVNGLANSSNGELPRVVSAKPKPYLARLYISHDFGFGSEKETVESDESQLGGERPLKRYTITAGRFTLTDFFDNNQYTHDPRTQFLGWGVMYNGAWDYPADVRGYTWGWVHELHLRNWSFRYASAAMPALRTVCDWIGDYFGIAVMCSRANIAIAWASTLEQSARCTTRIALMRETMPKRSAGRS